MEAKGALLAALVVATLECTTGAQERDVAQEIETVLAGIERPADVMGMRDALVQLAGDRIDLLVHELGRDGTPLRQAALVAALDRLPREAVLRHLTQLAREPGSEGDRMAALDLLARSGGRGELKLVLDLTDASESGAPLSSRMRSAFERALAGICEREPEAPRALAGFFARAQPAVQTILIDVIAERGGEDALLLLAGLLEGASTRTATNVLLAIGQTAGEDVILEDLLALERVRGLLGHPDPKLAVLACVAVEKLRDHESVPELIVLLEDHDPNLRRRAHSALRELTGLGLPPDAELWIEWLDESLAWWEERSDECRIALVSGATTEAAAAVHEVARQRLFLHDVVQLLALALHRSEPDVAKSACRALGAIHEPRARRALARLALHPDPELAGLALAAIERQQRAADDRPSSIRFPTRSATP